MEMCPTEKGQICAPFGNVEAVCEANHHLLEKNPPLMINKPNPVDNRYTPPYKALIRTTLHTKTL